MREEVAVVTVHDVAAGLLSRLGSMTTMKLQKLVYYCQAWHLARYGEPLFPDDVQAWREGPVVPRLYAQHRKQYMVVDWQWGDASEINGTAAEILDWVATRYGGFSAERLSRMTHNEVPWRIARRDDPESATSTEVIPHDLIKSYYGRQQVDPDSAVELAAASSALEGVELGLDWQDKLRDVATGLVSADDLVAAEIERAGRGG
jgi:uncharacterized phage-associated protein